MKYLETPGALLQGYKAAGVKHISNKDLLELKTDILIPAALENQINENNAEKINANIIIEAANGPTTVEADRILNKRGIPVLPDILTNAGGVVVSYFEWVQNIQSLSWTQERVNEELKKILDAAFKNVWDLANENKVSLRTGAYLVAVKRVVEAKKIRGIWP